MYIYITTPIYNGETAGNNYWQFFSVCFKELLGLPSTLIFSVALLSSLYLALKNPYRKPILLLISVFLIYYWKFGSFPRLETRFVLPIVPFWLIMSGLFWQKIQHKKKTISIILSIIIGYNVICSFYVGNRFLEAPRMVAQDWVQKNIPSLSSLERNPYTPRWNLLPGVHLKITNLPPIAGRGKLFEEILKDKFKNQPLLLIRFQKSEVKRDEKLNWYSQEELVKRNPDYISIDSLGYDRFLKEQTLIKLYPEINLFFKNLLSQQYPYKIIFDQESKKTPSWVYPQKIDFLQNRIVILARKELSVKSQNSSQE